MGWGGVGWGWWGGGGGGGRGVGATACLEEQAPWQVARKTLP